MAGRAGGSGGAAARAGTGRGARGGRAGEQKALKAFLLAALLCPPAVFRACLLPLGLLAGVWASSRRRRGGAGKALARHSSYAGGAKEDRGDPEKKGWKISCCRRGPRRTSG